MREPNIFEQLLRGYARLVLKLGLVLLFLVLFMRGCA